MPYLYDHPHRPGKKITRQRLWQIRKAEQGRCPQCGNRRQIKNGRPIKGLCTRCYPRRRKAA